MNVLYKKVLRKQIQYLNKCLAEGSMTDRQIRAEIDEIRRKMALRERLCSI